MSAAADIQNASGAPLSGRSVVVTRALEQSGALAAPLEALGAEVLAFPVIAIADPPDWQPVDDAIRNLATYDWVVLTSSNAVERFFARLPFVDRSAEALSRVKVAAIGRSTAVRMRELGVEPDLIPAQARAEGMVEAFRGLGAGAGWRVLVPRALEAREVLPDELRALGATVDVVAVYRSVPAEPVAAVLERFRAGTIDAVTFTSGLIAKRFAETIAAAGLDAASVMRDVAVASIGPVTSDAIRELGYEVDVEAPQATMASLAEAIGSHFSAP
jgi:uroporphyrinogen III methyltransferase / synthase